MDRNEVRIGQNVTIASPRFPGVYRVTKINAVNVKVESLDGLQRVNVAPSFLTLAGEAPAAAAPAPFTTFTPTAPHLNPGTVVSFTHKGTTGLFVVTGETRSGYRIFRLGGSSRYFTGIPAQHLTVVPLADLADAL